MGRAALGKAFGPHQPFNNQEKIHEESSDESHQKVFPEGRESGDRWLLAMPRWRSCSRTKLTSQAIRSVCSPLTLAIMRP